MFKNVILTIILTISFALSAYASGKTIDPAMVITKKNAEEYLGFEVKEPKLKVITGRDGIVSSYCKYFPKNKIENTGKIALGVFEAGEKTEASTARKFYKKMLNLRKESDKPQSRVEMISDLGEEAYWYPRKKMLYILSGDIFFTLEVSKDDAGVSSDKGLEDLQQKLAEHQFILCMDVAKRYLMINYKNL